MSKSADSMHKAKIRAIFARIPMKAYVVHFDGQGDSGAVEKSFPVLSNDSKEEEILTKLALEMEGETVTNQLEEWALQVLPGGWEINEGSYGYVVVMPSGDRGCTFYARTVSEESCSDSGYAKQPGIDDIDPYNG